MKKKLLKFFGIVLAVILLLYGLLHTPPVRKAILGYMLNKLETYTGAGFHAESLSYNLFKWRFTIKKLSIIKKDHDQTQLPPFLKVERIIVVIPSPLCAGKTGDLEQLIIVQPEVNYIIRSDGEANFPFPPQDDTPFIIPPFIIRHLHLKDARVVYRDEPTDLQIDIPGLDLTMEWRSGKTHRLALEMLERGSLQWKSRTFPLDRISVRAGLDNRNLEFRTSTLRADREEIHWQGHIRDYTSAAPHLDLTLRGRFQAGELADLLPESWRVPGTLTVESYVRGFPADAEIEARFSADDFLISEPVAASVSGRGAVSLQGFSLAHLQGTGQVRFSPLPDPGTAKEKPLPRGIPLEGSLVFEARPGKMVLEGHRLKAAGLTMEGRWEKNSRGMKGNLAVAVPDIKASLQKLEALRLEPGLNRAVSSALRAGVTGNAFVKATLGGPLEAPLLKVGFHATLPIRQVSPYQVQGNLSLERGVVQVSELEIRQDQQYVQVSGIIPAAPPKGRPSPIRLTLRGEHIDTAALQPYLGVAFPWQGMISLVTGMEIDRTASRVNAVVDRLELVAEEQELKALGPFRLALDSTGLTVDHLNLAGSGTSIQAAGHLNWGEKTDLSHPPFTVTAGIDSRLVQGFFPYLAASGRIRLQGEIRGSLAQPIMNGRLEWVDGAVSLEGVPGALKPIDLHLNLAGDEVTIDTFTFAWEGARFSLKGGLGLGKGFSLALEARSLSTALIAPWLPAGWAERIEGTLDTDLKIRGQRLAPDSVSGTGLLHNLQLSLDGFPFRQSGPAHLTLDKGTVTLENFALAGPESSLRAKTSLTLSGFYPLEAEISGEVDCRVLNGIWEAATFSGTKILDFRVTGDLTHPVFSGEIRLQNCGLQHPEYHLYISGINGKVRIEDGLITTPEPLRGGFNGGDLQILGKSPVGIHFKGVKLEVPLGLLSEAAGDLIVEPRGKGSPGYKLKGSIAITNGIYKEPYFIDSQLYRFFRQSASRLVIEPLESTTLPLDIDINLYSEAPIRVDNNIARAEISAALKLSGPAANPILAGRAEIKAGGEIYLGNNTFYIERGDIHFVNPARIEPELDISARTQIADHEIRLRITGTPQALTASLTSTPPLPEANIIALLVSGKPIENTSPSLLSEAGNITLNYLGNAIAGKIEEAVKQTLGLDTLRVDGSLVASKEDPGARLTVGDHLTSNLEVIYSQGLRDSQDRTWIVNYDPVKGLNLQAVRQDDNAYSLAANHRIRFGLKKPDKPSLQSGSKPKAASTPGKISEIVISGNLQVPEPEIRKKLKVKTGKTFQFFKFQEGLKRIRRYYHRLNYLNARVNGRKEEDRQKIRLVLEIDAGTRVFFKFQGAPVPRRFMRHAEETWIKGQNPRQRIDTIYRQLRLYFFKKRYFNIDIRDETASDAGGNQYITFHITRNTRYRPLQVHYQGNHYRSGRQLSALLKKASLFPSVLIQPEAASRFLERWYRQEGFLAAAIAPPGIQWQEEDREAIVFFSVAEGPRFKIGKIRFSGNRFLDSETLASGLQVRTGDPLSAQRLDAAAAALEAFYAARGFYDTRVTVELKPDETEARTDVLFNLSETPRRRIEEIRISGNQVTRTSAIRRELSFKDGDLMDLKTLNKTRKKLYDMGVFERVDIEASPLAKTRPDAAAAAKPDLPAGNAGQEPEQPCVINVEVKEQKPFLLKYGVQWNTETGTGISGEFDHYNFTGNASLLGTAFSYNSMEQDARVYSRFPYFLGKKINTELVLFAHREEESPSTVVERLGITLQQQFRLTRKSLVSIGYTFEHYRSATEVNLGHLTAAFTFDTRNNVLNATRGLFISQSFQYAGKFLGSQAGFSRYTGQYSFYQRVFPRLVLAASLHLGLGKGLGNPLLPGERFFAGGGTTIRGFKYNSVGPFNPVTQEPEGGEALFIFKQELRLQLNQAMGAVVFLDLGNVYSLVTEFDPFKVRKAAGFGLRFNLSGLLLRLDWGFKLDRRPGESSSNLFFGIGQSF